MNFATKIFVLRNRLAVQYDPDDYMRYRARLRQQTGTAAGNKTKLLSIAEGTELRPAQRDHDLGKALTRYTTPGPAYDPEFYGWIRLIEPSWFDQRAIRSKLELERMAASGAPRPAKSVPIGKALIRYTTGREASSWRSAYDGFFDVLIRRLRPDWFVPSSDKNKERLWAWIEVNRRRPEQTIKDRDERLMGQLLNNYRRPESETYDPIFMRKLIAEYPFIGLTSKQETQADIITFFTQQGRKPSQTSDDPMERRLAVNMYAYTNRKKGQYDADFAVRLAALT